MGRLTPSGFSMRPFLFIVHHLLFGKKMLMLQSYAAWSQRRFIVDIYAAAAVDVPQTHWDFELKLCAKFLELDSRNCMFTDSCSLDR